jgi:hypothetical protein
MFLPSGLRADIWHSCATSRLIHRTIRTEKAVSIRRDLFLLRMFSLLRRSGSLVSGSVAWSVSGQDESVAKAMVKDRKRFWCDACRSRSTSLRLYVGEGIQKAPP